MSRSKYLSASYLVRIMGWAVNIADVHALKLSKEYNDDTLFLHSGGLKLCTPWTIAHAKMT